MEFFLGLKNKEKVNGGVWFYFFIPMVFGLLRPGFVLCNFSQNSLFILRGNFLHFMIFFGNLFFRKEPSNGFLMEINDQLSFLVSNIGQWYGGLFPFANFFNLLSCL